MSENNLEEQLARKQQQEVFGDDMSRYVESALSESDTLQKRVALLEEQRKNLKFRLEQYKKTNHKDAILIDQLLKKIDEFRDMAFYDDLTGLYKRKAFVELLKCFQGAGVDKGCLVLLDIDKFKSINDFYGHKKGDEVLVKVSNFLGQSFRATDPMTRISIKEPEKDFKTHTVGRMGGEEIAIFVPNASLEDIQRIFQRISENPQDKTLDVTQASLEINLDLGSEEQETLRLTNAGGLGDLDIQSRKNKITFSGGVVQVGLGDVNNMEEFVNNKLHVADSALYEAKQSGRNKIIFISNDETEK